MRDTLASEIRNGFGEVRNDLVQNREELAQTFNQAFTDGIARNLSGDLQRISDGIARLQESHNMHPDYVEQMQAEMGSLNAGIGKY